MERSKGPRIRQRRVRVVVAALLMSLWLLVGAPGQAAHPPEAQFVLTVLHNNDGESQLIDAGTGLEDFGGVARFKALVDQLKFEATHGPAAVHGAKRGVVMLSSGDNFLAGPEFNASLEKGVPFFDSIALDKVGYDAVAIGNHEFDFGPEVLADFIRGFKTQVPFLSANLDVSAEPELDALADQGRIVPSTVIKERGERIGIVGATTPQLPFISSPRNVRVDPDVAGTIQAEIDALEANGVNKIILISHLQSIEEDLELAPQLRGVDVMIAGGGDELLANEGDLLVPGDEGAIFGPYPLMVKNADDVDVPVITTPGSYKYVGELAVGFDKKGNIVTLSSGPVRVSGIEPDAVTPDPEVQELVTEPVQAAVASLAQNVIATSQVALDGRRSPGVRTAETNEGNLVSDSLLFQAAQLAPDFGAPEPDVALQNGGGIRNDGLIPAGPITELNTFDIVPFANFVSIVPGVPASQFKEILENAVSRVEFSDGRFAQIAGFSLVWDASRPARTLDEAGNVVTQGSRVREVTLDDSTPIVADGVVAPDAPALDVATIDFLARGGDQYPFAGAPFTTLGVTYQQALASYIVGGLDGVITAGDYPEGGEGRITRLN